MKTNEIKDSASLVGQDTSKIVVESRSTNRLSSRDPPHPATFCLSRRQCHSLHRCKDCRWALAGRCPGAAPQNEGPRPGGQGKQWLPRPQQRHCDENVPASALRRCAAGQGGWGGRDEVKARYRDLQPPPRPCLEPMATQIVLCEDFEAPNMRVEAQVITTASISRMPTEAPRSLPWTAGLRVVTPSQAVDSSAIITTPAHHWRFQMHKHDPSLVLRLFSAPFLSEATTWPEQLHGLVQLSQK